MPLDSPRSCGADNEGAPATLLETAHFSWIAAMLTVRLAIRIAIKGEKPPPSRLSFTRILLLVLYCWTSYFCASICLSYFSHTISNQSSCQVATALGLTFYLGRKYCVYLFLLAHTHSQRVALRPRLKDSTFLTASEACSFVLVGITGAGVATSVLDTSSHDSGFQTCRTGSANPVAFNFLIWDVSVNIFLTLVFSRHFATSHGQGIVLQTVCYLVSSEIFFNSGDEGKGAQLRRVNLQLSTCAASCNSEDILGVLLVLFQRWLTSHFCFSVLVVRKQRCSFLLLSWWCV
jgi:hypothetical protein